MRTAYPTRLLAMDFPERLAALRKAKKLTQQTLADQVKIHVTQIRRYENGDSQPTLDVIRKLSIALNVNADVLVFDRDERGPSDELRLQFEAVSQFPEEERRIIQALLDGMIIKYQTKRMVSSFSS